MKRTAWLLALFALPLFLAGARAEDSYRIKCKTSREGDVGIFTREISEENHSVFDMAGVSRPIDITNKETAKFKEEILKQEGDKPATKLRRTYEKAQSTWPAGKLADLPYSGKVVLIERKSGPAKFRIEGGEELEAKAVPSLAKEFKHDDESFKLDDFAPAQAVTVGHSWKLNREQIKKLLSSKEVKADFDKSKGTGKLLKAYRKDGKQYGVLKFEFEIPILSAGPADAELKCAPGTPLLVTIDADVCIDGSADAGTVAVKEVLKGEGQVGTAEIHFNVTSTSKGTREEVKK